MNRLRYFLLQSDARWVVLLITIAVIFFLLFYFDYTREADIGSRKIIGKIVYKNNIVQRKFSDEVVWASLSSNSPLTNMDLIRSENLSDAIIYLNDDTKIKIDENSMFFLDLSGDEFKLQFEGGSIQIEQGKYPDIKSMTIQSGDALINVGDADLKIASGPLGQKNNQLDLYVQKGQAQLSLAGKQSSIQANQKARIEGKKVAVKDVEVRLLKPAAQDLLTVSENAKIPFQFKTAPGYSNARLEIAHDRSFNRVLQDLNSNEARSGVNLSPGTYYWRVKVKEDGSGKSVSSELRRFRVVPNKPVQTYQPAPNQAITFVDGNPSVGFAWAPSELANSYTLELSQNKSFNGKLRRFQTQSSSFTVNDLPPGDWYWRVRSKSELDGVEDQISGIQKISIQKKDGYDAPVVERPQANMQVAPSAFQDGVLFVWNSMPEIKNYTFEISDSSSFKSTKVQTVTANNFYSVTEKLAVGKWFWRVQGHSASGKKSAWSTPASFLVSAEKDVKDPTTQTDDTRQDDGSGQLKLLQPAGTVDMSSQNRLGFYWRPDARAQAYRFTLYQIKNGRRKRVYGKQVLQNRFVLTDLSVLDVGLFEWHVQSLKSGRIIASESQRVNIRLSESPRGLSPDDVEFTSPKTIYK